MAKAQIQMGETIAVLVVFFFLIVIGLVFYVNIASSKIEQSKVKNTELESVNVVKRALSLPELQCSHNNIVDDACVDVYKLEGMRGLSPADKAPYFDLFGTSTISFKRIYPPGDLDGEIYNFSLGQGNYTSRLATTTPLSLFDPLDGSYDFGIIEVVVYGR